MIKKTVQTISLILITAALTVTGYVHRDDMHLGWAKRLDGKTAVVAVFASDNACNWNEADLPLKEEMLGYLDIACKYLEEECRDYGAKTELIHAVGCEDDLLYMEADIEGDITGADPYTPAIDSFLNSKTVLDKKSDIFGRYCCNSVVYIFFVNTPEDNPYSSLSYMWMKPGDPEDEFTILYSYVNHIKEGPVSIAHEITHAFGAPDLYTSVEVGYDLGITDEYVKHLYDIGSDDLMFSVYDVKTGKMSYDTVNKHFSELDAYYTGLIDGCDDVDSYGLGRSIYTNP